MERDLNNQWYRLWDTEYAKLVDKLSCDRFHIPDAALMETAGRAIAAELSKICSPQSHLLILVGNGNNGGDALVAARVLHDRGHHVKVIHVPHEHPIHLSHLAQVQFQCIEKLGLSVERYAPGLIGRNVNSATIILDGILGLGFRGEMRQGPVRDALAEAAASHCQAVVAIDVPSGLDPNAVGEGFAEPPLAADVTITFGGYRPCHVAAPWRSRCGSVVVLDIGFPRAATSSAAKSVDMLWLRGEKPLPNPYVHIGTDRHKFDRGMILVVGGSSGKTGAMELCALSAARTGGGWVSMAPLVQAGAYEYPDFTREDLLSEGALCSQKLANILDSRPIKALVIGPGTVGQLLDLSAMKVLRDFTEQGGFVVLDAGATHRLRPLLKQVPLISDRAVVTPHPGEWIKMGMAANPGTDPEKHIALSKELGITLLYKNSTPFLFSADLGCSVICDYGGPELSKAGTGDVLAGVIGALGAAGLNAVSATQRGLAIMGTAGKLSSLQYGAEGNLASDFVHWLGVAQQSI